MLIDLGTEFDKQKVAQGVYIAEFDFNFNHELTGKGIEMKKMRCFEPIIDDGQRYVSSYGVCDDSQQILEKKYVIGLTLVKKEWEPSDGGWRWHKWGDYIGNQNPRCEYIYDEPEIEQVYCFEVYEIA